MADREQLSILKAILIELIKSDEKDMSNPKLKGLRGYFEGKRDRARNILDFIDKSDGNTQS